MQELNLLIEKAAAIAGSRYRLAKALKVTPARVYGWQTGEPCPPADVALMAHIAGLDATQWLVWATLERYEGDKAAALQQALGKPRQATGEAPGAGAAGGNKGDIPQGILKLTKRRKTIYTRYHKARKGLFSWPTALRLSS